MNRDVLLSLITFIKLYTMKKSILTYIGIFFLVISFTACTDDFEELNTDPNEPTSVPTSYLLTNAQRDAQEFFFYTGSIYIQHMANTQYTRSTDLYEVIEASFYEFYSDELNDFEEIIRLNTSEDTRDAVASSGANNNQIGVARIMKVFMFHQIADTWGDVPYSEALLGRENFSPAYDLQENVYRGMLTELREAAAQLDGGTIDGDLIYGGDTDMWRKFANSLRLRLAMRMSEVDPGTAQSEINDALAGGVFESNDDNALYRYLSDANNDNPIFAHFLTRTDYAIAETLVDFMRERNDPRLDIYGDPAPNFGEVRGMPVGLSESIAGSITNDEISFPGMAVRSATSPGIMMTYAEVAFIKSEAAARGWIAEDAQMLYEEAITASVRYWEGVSNDLGIAVEPSDVDAFLTQPGVAWDAANDIQLISEQKWVSLYTQGVEAWANWRRTSWPVLVGAPDAVEGRDIPRRRAYTNDEFQLNQENYNAALSRMGGSDLMSTPTWWDPGRIR